MLFTYGLQDLQTLYNGAYILLWSHIEIMSSLTVKYENSVYFVWYYGFYLYMREV